MLLDGIITDCATRLREKDAAKLDDFDDDFERLFAQLVERRLPRRLATEGGQRRVGLLKWFSDALTRRSQA